ncbi:MAG TPA: hypothetical protein VFO19_14450 [Vicinamibacterales bacterium]|nr:hypothetical protein [Vicinamibacterales bacterium]
MRIVPLLITLAAVVACGSTPGPSSTPAVIEVIANPAAVAGTTCTGCGAGGDERQAVTTLTIRETAGTGGTIAAIVMTLRETGTDAIVAQGEFDQTAVTQIAGSARVPGSGSRTVPNVGPHYPATFAGRAGTLTFTVRLRDDLGNDIARDVSVPVSGM